MPSRPSQGLSDTEVNVGTQQKKTLLPGSGFSIGLALVLGGCIFGGEGENSTEEEGPASAGNLALGVYRGDYGPSGDSLLLESELILGEGGSYTFVGVQVNDAALVMTGKVSITPDKHFATSEVRQVFSVGGNGLFDSADWTDGLPDTTFLRNITATSFERYEPFPGAAAPRSLWVKYTKMNYGRLQEGHFDTEATYEDSTGTYLYRTLVRLEAGEPYLQREFENDVEYQQIESAGWRHQGSFLVTDHNILRAAADSTSPLEVVAEFGGEIYYRVQDADSDGFKLWYGPVDEFDVGAWVEYKRTDP